MSLAAYRVIHIFSMMLMFTALGGLLLASQAKVQTDAPEPSRATKNANPYEGKPGAA